MQKTGKKKTAKPSDADLREAACRSSLSIARGTHFIFGPVAGAAAVTALQLAHFENQALVALRQLATLVTIIVGNRQHSSGLTAASPPPRALRSLLNKQPGFTVGSIGNSSRIMYHQHSQQQGQPPFSNGPRPSHRQPPPSQHPNHPNMQRMGFQFPRPTQLPDELESALSARGARDMDHRQMDHMNQNQGPASRVNQHGNYGSNPMSLPADNPPALQPGLDWSNFQPPVKLFANPPPNVGCPPQQHPAQLQQPPNIQAGPRVPNWAPPVSDAPSAQTRHPHAGGEGQNLYTPESAGSILASFGLSNEDLEVLSHYPDDQLTPDTLPFILRDIQIHKSSNPVVSTSTSSFSRSVRDVPLPPSSSSPLVSSEVPSFLTVTQTAGKVIDYGHASRAKDGGETFKREPLSSERTVQMYPTSSTAPSAPKTGKTERRQIRLEASDSTKHGDRDYRRTSGNTRKSTEFQTMPKSRQQDRDYRRDRTKPRPSSESRSEASSRRSLSSSSGSKAHGGGMTLPTPTMISDFSAVSPKVYPHTCSLCNIQCDQEKEWIEHVNTVSHTAACRDLRNKYPDWKPDSPSRSRQHGRRALWDNKDDSPSFSTSPSPSPSLSPGKLRVDGRAYRPHGRLGSPHRPHGRLGSPHRPHGRLGSPQRPLGRLGSPHRPHGRLGSPHRPHGRLGSPHRPHGRLGSPHRPHGRLGSPHRHARQYHHTERRHHAEHHSGSHSPPHPHRLSSREHWLPRGDRLPSGGPVRTGLKRPHEDSSPSTASSKHPPGKAVKAVTKPGTKTAFKAPPAKKKKKVGPPACRDSLAADRLVYLTGIPNDASEQEVTDLVCSFGKINNVILMPSSEEESEKALGQKASVCMMKAEDAQALCTSTSLFIREQSVTASGAQKPEAEQPSDANDRNPEQNEAAGSNSADANQKTTEKSTVLISGLPDGGCSQSDILDLFQSFLTPCDVIMATHLGKALVSVTDVEAVQEMIKVHSFTPARIKDTEVKLVLIQQDVGLSSPVALYNLLMGSALPPENPVRVGWSRLLVIRNVPPGLSGSSEVQRLVQRFGTVTKTLVLDSMVICEMATAAMALSVYKRFQTFPCIIHRNPLLFSRKPDPKASTQCKVIAAYLEPPEDTPANGGQTAAHEEETPPEETPAPPPEGLEHSGDGKVSSTETTVEDEASRQVGNEEGEEATPPGEPSAGQTVTEAPGGEEGVGESEAANQEAPAEPETEPTAEDTAASQQILVPPIPKMTQAMVNALLEECRIKTAKNKAAPPSGQQEENPNDLLKKQEKEWKAKEARQKQRARERERSEKERRLWEKEERARRDKERFERAQRDRERRERKRCYGDGLPRSRSSSRSEGRRQNSWWEDERSREEAENKTEEEQEEEEEFPFNMSDFVTVDEVGDVADLPAVTMETSEPLTLPEDSSTQAEAFPAESLASDSAAGDSPGQEHVPTCPAEAQEDPKDPEDLKAPEAAEALQDLKDPEDFKAPETAENPEDVKAPEAAEDVKAPEAAEDVKAPEAAEDVKAPEAAEDLKAPEAVEDLKAPEAAEDLKAPEAAEDLKAPEAAEDLKAPEAAEDLKAPEAAENLKAPEAAENPEDLKAAAAGATPEPDSTLSTPAAPAEEQEEGSNIPEGEGEEKPSEDHQEMKDGAAEEEKLQTSEEKLKNPLKKTKHSLPPFDPSCPVGLEFLIPKTGFFCKVCRRFFSGAREAEMNHCKTLKHYENLQKYLLTTQAACVTSKMDSS